MRFSVDWSRSSWSCSSSSRSMHSLSGSQYIPPSDPLHRSFRVQIPSKVGPLHLAVREQVFRRPFHDNPAGFKNIPAIGDAQRGLRVLLDEENRVALPPESLD